MVRRFRLEFHSWYRLAAPRPRIEPAVNRKSQIRLKKQLRHHAAPKIDRFNRCLYCFTFIYVPYCRIANIQVCPPSHARRRRGILVPENAWSHVSYIWIWRQTSVVVTRAARAAREFSPTWRENAEEIKRVFCAAAATSPSVNALLVVSCRTDLASQALHWLHRCSVALRGEWSFHALTHFAQSSKMGTVTKDSMTGWVTDHL